MRKKILFILGAFICIIASYYAINEIWCAKKLKKANILFDSYFESYDTTYIIKAIPYLEDIISSNYKSRHYKRIASYLGYQYLGIMGKFKESENFIRKAPKYCYPEYAKKVLLNDMIILELLQAKHDTIGAKSIAVEFADSLKQYIDLLPKKQIPYFAYKLFNYMTFLEDYESASNIAKAYPEIFGKDPTEWKAFDNWH